MLTPYLHFFLHAILFQTTDSYLCQQDTHKYAPRRGISKKISHHHRSTYKASTLEEHHNNPLDRYPHSRSDVPYDPLHYDAQHLFVCIDPNTREHQLIWFKTGDGEPPNGIALAGSGDTFPDTLVDGDYYLRDDFDKPLLYQKQGTTFKKIEVDTRKLPWTGANQVLDTFIDNDNITTNDDGSTESERQALSKVVRAQPKDE